jgi:hypothetical protein
MLRFPFDRVRLLGLMLLLVSPAYATGILESLTGSPPPGIVPVSALPAATATKVPSISEVAASKVEEYLGQVVRDLVGHADRMVDTIGMKLPPEEDRKTRNALIVLFRRAKIEELAITGATPTGHVERLRIRLRDIDVYGLRVDAMEAELKGIDLDVPELIDHKNLRFTRECQTHFAVRMLQDDLCRASPNYQFELRKNDIGISGKTGFLFIKAGVHVHGNVVPTPANQLIFRPSGVTYGFLPVPKLFYNSSVQKLNPLFDMARFLGSAKCGLDVKFDLVDIQDKHLDVHLRGTMRAGQTAPPTPAPANPGAKVIASRKVSGAAPWAWR